MSVKCLACLDGRLAPRSCVCGRENGLTFAEFERLYQPRPERKTGPFRKWTPQFITSLSETETTEATTSGRERASGDPDLGDCIDE